MLLFKVSQTINKNMPSVEKRQADMRNFSNDVVPQSVKDTYRSMHTNQTLEFVRRKHEYWGRLDHAEMTIMEVLELLKSYRDLSDPDVDIANAYHGFQTAEAIRKCHPDKEWFHLVGLIHDCGKIMGIWGEPAWSTVGDTYPLGCEPVNEIAFGRTSFVNNPDLMDPKLNSKFGMYEENCGLDNVTMSWGHDEYLYQVLMGNKHNLPEVALYIIRFHSFYAWHTGRQYDYLCSEKDLDMLPMVKEFQKFDLYSKTDSFPDIAALELYYQKLIDKFVPGKLRW